MSVPTGSVALGAGAVNVRLFTTNWDMHIINFVNFREFLRLVDRVEIQGDPRAGALALSGAQRAGSLLHVSSSPTHEPLEDPLLICSAVDPNNQPLTTVNPHARIEEVRSEVRERFEDFERSASAKQREMMQQIADNAQRLAEEHAQQQERVRQMIAD